MLWYAIKCKVLRWRISLLPWLWKLVRCDETVSESERKSMILNIPCVTVDSDWSRVKTTLHQTLKIYCTNIHKISIEKLMKSMTSNKLYLWAYIAPHKMSELFRCINCYLLGRTTKYEICVRFYFWHTKFPLLSNILRYIVS